MAWLPNALTVFRVIMLPVLMYLIFKAQLGDAAPCWGWAAMGLFIACAFTDFLDGYLARKMKLVSAFGRMLDPIADKLLVAGCLVAFCVNFGAQWIVLVPAMAIIFRDIFVSGLREHAGEKNMIVPPSRLAKFKTAAEMLAIGLLIGGLLVLQNALPILLTHVGFAVLWIAALLSVLTGFFYYRAVMKAPAR